MSNSDITNIKKPEMEDLIVKLKEIQSGLKQNLSVLHQKLETLAAKPELLSSLESFKKDAEVRACNLEAEVKQLREELLAIKKLLGLNREKNLVDS